MAHPPSEEQLPDYALLDDDRIAKRDKFTRDGIWDLYSVEITWRDRARYLLEHGYVLRPRYQPGWTPSWLGTNRNPFFCEDAAMIFPTRTMDARKRDTGELVAIKKVKNDNQEIQILKYIESRRDTTCHCVTIIETLPDPLDPLFTLMFLPLLRRYSDPNFCAVGEVISFIDQSIEVGTLNHLPDIAEANVMMDARNLIPTEWHPVNQSQTPDGVYKIKPRSRTYFPVQYFYIDFGHSVRFKKGCRPLVIGDIGRDDTVLELSHDIPYEAFPVDIHALGSLYLQDLQEKYYSLDFLAPLTESMRHPDPARRPTIHQVHEQWQQIRSEAVELSHIRISAKAATFFGRVIQQAASIVGSLVG
ncbi:kinase-like protein [Epithele typhae]|uniref:kinase-like protein n=1 Tax=Epithele typhae TaxID=378194 RepID=UPI0020080C6D|nr:kinase-like protein [Epithele typhae]KAH9935119.1 kinase-like protein [Epithele typhae]